MSSGPRTIGNTFKNSLAPAGYVAGLGRGATAFTTRSDIGPADTKATEGGGGGILPGGVVAGGGGGMGANASASSLMGPPRSLNNPFASPNFGQAPVGYVAGRGRAMGALAAAQNEAAGRADDGDKSDYSESMWNKTTGYQERLFSNTAYDDDDREADNIYASVDEKMAARNKKSKEKELLEKNKNSNRPTNYIFADLKQNLGALTSDEWNMIPEVGDHSLKYKQKRNADVFTPVPDSIIAAFNANNPNNNALNKSIDVSGGGGGGASGGMDSVMGSSTGLAHSRGSTLTNKLDKISDSVSGQTVVDPKGYLTSMNSIEVFDDATISDFKRARTLLSSVTSTNPKHAPGWMAAARVEEKAGKLVEARKIIRQGCEACPESEDIWIEAARLHPLDDAKVLLAQAVKNIPNSVNIWIEAANLESDQLKKKMVLRRALEFIPNSVKLWKAAIELEDAKDARIMLSRAVECVPHAVEMWLQLAKLETHENARKVLNHAREANPTDPLPWINAAQLEEAHGIFNIIDKIIAKMMASLDSYQVVIGRDKWIKEAVACELAGSKYTCGSIIRNSIFLNVEEIDRQKTWIHDAEACLTMQPPAVDTARAIYAFALSIFRDRRTLWLNAADLEKTHGTPQSLEAILREGVKNCPHEEILWLMAAKEKWLQKDVASARGILDEAFVANPKSSQIWLAAIKLEWENNEFNNARKLLSKARDKVPSEKVYMKSALLECELGDTKQEMALLDAGIKLFPSFSKFYMMAGQACVDALNDPAKARDYYQAGLKYSPDCVPLWKLLVALEEKFRGVAKARSVIETSRLKLPRNEELWLESIKLEQRNNFEKLGEALMAKAIQECPSSGLLWSHDLLTCDKTKQKSKSVDALKKCDNDPNVILAIARLFDKEGKVQKARKWYEKSVIVSPKIGDAWAYFYAFELRQSGGKSSTGIIGGGGGDILESQGGSSLESIAERCTTADPNRGELWCQVTKLTPNRRLDISKKIKKVVEHILKSDYSKDNSIVDSIASSAQQNTVDD